MLLLVAAVVLLVSGIGIMNIMLATVSSRIREIGIRKALGATNREIRFQFLAEAMTISLVGGLIGVVIGLAIPYSVRFLTEYRIPISGLSAIVAILVSSFVGVIFGTVPATQGGEAGSGGEFAVRVKKKLLALAVWLLALLASVQCWVMAMKLRARELEAP